MTRTLPDSIGNAMSLLTDDEIKTAVKQKYFFYDFDQYSESKVRQASYELQLGEVRTIDGLEVRRYEDNGSNSLDKRKSPAFISVVDGNEYLNINPRCCCTLYTVESVALPDNVAGRVNARGQIFESGIILESTYIDPGFDGTVHLVAFNSTDRIVRIPKNVAIARLEFMKLSKVVSNPHKGRSDIKPSRAIFEPVLWPSDEKNPTDSVLAAKDARDNTHYHLSHDYLIIATEKLIKNTNQAEIIARWNRVFIICAVGFFILFNSSDYIVSLGSEKFWNAHGDLKGWVEAPLVPFIGAFLIFLINLLKKDLRDSLFAAIGRHDK